MNNYIKNIFNAILGRKAQPKVRQHDPSMEMTTGRGPLKPITIEPGDTKFSLIGAQSTDGERCVLLSVEEAQVVELEGKLCQILPFSIESATDFAVSLIACAALLDPEYGWGGAEEDGDD